MWDKKALFAFGCVIFVCAVGVIADRPEEHERDDPAVYLDEIEQQLNLLGEQEQELRGLWMRRNREIGRQRQTEMIQDEDIRALQEEMRQKMLEAQQIQAEIERRLLAISPIPDDMQPDLSQEDLQQQIMEIQSQRRALIQERAMLQRNLQPKQSQDTSAPTVDEEGSE